MRVGVLRNTNDLRRTSSIMVGATARCAGGGWGGGAGPPRHSHETMQDSSAADDSAADARAQSQQDQVVVVTAGAHPLLAQRGGVGIVLEHYRRAELALDLVA